MTIPTAIRIRSTLLLLSLLCSRLLDVLGFSGVPSNAGWTNRRNAASLSLRRNVNPPSRLIQYSTPDNNNCDPNSSCDKNEPTATSSEPTSSSTSFPTSPLLLNPFLPAADPRYILEGPVGEEEFILQRHGGPRAEELTNENMLRIVLLQCSDLEVNTLVWKCLGYRFVQQLGDDDNNDSSSTNSNSFWSNEEVFPKWRERYPQPPDLIGMQRTYSKEIDQVSLRSNQALVRSVPLEKKQSLKTHLMPLGFKGYKYAELTPNKTRRAQCTNWLLYYREELFGYTVEELKERRRLQDEAVQQEINEGEWKPPVQQVF